MNRFHIVYANQKDTTDQDYVSYIGVKHTLNTLNTN